MSHPKRRQLSDDQELQAWKNVFHCGRDYFYATEAVGIAPDAYRKINADQVRAAWKRLRRRYLDELWPVYQCNNSKGAREKPWAVEQFGEPE